MIELSESPAAELRNNGSGSRSSRADQRKKMAGERSRVSSVKREEILGRLQFRANSSGGKSSRVKLEKKKKKKKQERNLLL